MKKEEFLATARKIATETHTRYELGGVGQYRDGVFLFDCCGLPKSIIWGFDFDKNASRGGAIYKSNGLDDVGANRLFEEYCYDISDNMSITEPGELVWMDGHIGIYDKDLKIIEATSDGNNDVQITTMDYDGRRFVNGYQVLHWEKHGKFKCVEYSTPEYKFKKGDIVILNGWLHETNSSEQCVGEYHDYVWTITDIKDGEYPYQLNNIGWCREKYLTPYASDDFKQKYEKEALTSKDLEKQVDQLKKEKENLQAKIEKAIKCLK